MVMRKTVERKKTKSFYVPSLKKVKKASNMNTYNLKDIRNEEDVDKMIKDLK